MACEGVVQEERRKLPGKGGRVHLIGIKGTGMCALAELLHRGGLWVSGSDGAEVFYTDAILKELGIPYYESFDAAHVDPRTDLAIHSAAYSAPENPEMAEALRRGIPLLKYTDALGAWSAGFDASGIAGVHGKTTTTAITGTLLRGAALPAQILAGSAVASFGGRSTLSLGDKYFVAETCEYRRHFLAFHPRRIVLTSVEPDHPDYYPTYESIRDAFVEYGRKLPAGGELFYCADDPGAQEVADILRREERGFRFVPYGFSAGGEWRIEEPRIAGERQSFRIAAFPGELRLRIPGRHAVLDTAAALALTSSLVRAEFGGGDAGDGWNGTRREGVRQALEDFTGSRRRSEILGEAGGILFMDDYAHHPTAIRSTLEGLRDFYPRRRLVISFMSHTYTRTAVLFEDFAASFARADVLALHKIYPSARENYRGELSGRTLFERVKALRGAGELLYTEEPLAAAESLKGILREGDLFITMGAGDNWKLGRSLLAYYRGTPCGA
jgi:UDP-N-acetylmuramate--alanine ligase